MIHTAQCIELRRVERSAFVIANAKAANAVLALMVFLMRASINELNNEIKIAMIFCRLNSFWQMFS